ncbi:Hypothetical predicted protein, partial [Mytilus galloprovincialis]
MRLLKLAIQNNCTIITSPVDNHASFIESCEDDPKVMISKCNKTGTWLNGDNAILNACQSVDQPFGMFKNVFCYICNPPFGHKEVITSCSSNNHNTSLFQLCNNSLPNASMYPYKNKFCYQCNFNQSLDNAIDILYKHLGLEHVYYVLPRYCNGQSQMAMYYGNTTAVVVDTLQMNVTDSQNSNEDIPFTRQWQYMITCPRQEIFSMFFSANDIIQESLLRGCNNAEPVSKYKMQCVSKPQLIRECSEPIDPIGAGGAGGYRSMLLLSSYDQSIGSSLSHSCSSQQIFDSSLNICRNLRCIPGKVLVNNTCIPLLQMTADLCYIFAVHFDAIISENVRESVGIDMIRKLADEAFDDLNA